MEVKKDEFSDEPETRWLTNAEKPDRNVELLKPFTYWDREGTAWTAKAESEVDGASIPKPLWALVGSPFTGDYRRASIVHDVYCIDGQPHSDRRKADRMYYFACRKGGCGFVEALVHYIGVSIGGWIPGVNVVNVFAAGADPKVSVSDDEVDDAAEIIIGTYHELRNKLMPFAEDADKEGGFTQIEELVDRQLSLKTLQLGEASPPPRSIRRATSTKTKRRKRK